MIWHLILATLAIHGTLALNNGLARTPPMGWLTWQRFRCNTDCKNDPDNCISENLMKAQAVEMVKQGFKDAGYEYVIVDDCWLDHNRDKDGKLQPDPERFPSGMKALGDFIHGLGLKFGIYEDYGTHTCAGYPGVIDNLELDAKTLAEFGADYIKLDGCNADTSTMNKGYPEFGKYLNQTGRPIVYSCEWPLYDQNADLPSVAEHCNMWRNHGDIQDSWDSVMNTIKWYAQNQDKISHLAGPGAWNDPDMVVVGDFGLSYDQSRVHMAAWSVFASPLIMSNDLRRIKPEHKELLLNKNVLKINQDPLGIQGRLLNVTGNLNLFFRPINPAVGQNKSAAVAIINYNDGGSGDSMMFTPKSINLNHPKGYMLSEVFSGIMIGQAMPDTRIKVRVNPSGVQFLRFDVIKDKVDLNINIANDMYETDFGKIEIHQSMP